MASKCVYIIDVIGEGDYSVTVKHVKYSTRTFECRDSSVITFESFINWDVNSFQISASKSVKILSIKFKISDEEALSVSNRLQKIDSVDLYPERTKFLKESATRLHGVEIREKYLDEFVPMNIGVGSIANVRFTTKVILKS